MSVEKQNYTEKQKLFLECLSDPINKGDIRTAMTKAGYSDNSPISLVVDSLHEEIVNISLRLIASNSTKASLAIIELLDNPKNLNAKTILATAKEVLDRAGVVSKQKEDLSDLNREIIVILPEKVKSDD